MIGSYGPSADAYEKKFLAEEAPSGMLARGHYDAKVTLFLLFLTLIYLFICFYLFIYLFFSHRVNLLMMMVFLIWNGTGLSILRRIGKAFFFYIQYTSFIYLFFVSKKN